jgi:hypothetical protein
MGRQYGEAAEVNSLFRLELEPIRELSLLFISDHYSNEKTTPHLRRRSAFRRP